MKKIKLNLIVILILMPLLTFCGGVRDEFLVKKKNPLQIPPDMNKLPIPGENLEISSQNNNTDEVKDLLQIKEKSNTENTSSGSDLLNNMKKKIQ